MKVRSSSAERENCEQSPQVKIRLRRSERVKSEVYIILRFEALTGLVRAFLNKEIYM